MYRRIRHDLAVFWLTLSGCVNGAYFGGKYAFPDLTNRADATIFGLLIGALIALMFYTFVYLLVISSRR